MHPTAPAQDGMSYNLEELVGFHLLSLIFTFTDVHQLLSIQANRRATTCKHITQLDIIVQ